MIRVWKILGIAYLPSSVEAGWWTLWLFAVCDAGKCNGES